MKSIESCTLFLLIFSSSMKSWMCVCVSSALETSFINLHVDLYFSFLICRATDPTPAASAETLAHLRNLARLSQFYRYFCRRHLSELAEIF